MVVQRRQVGLPTGHHGPHSRNFLRFFPKIFLVLLTKDFLRKIPDQILDGPTRTENSLAYYILATSVDYQKTHSSSAQLETGTISQKKPYLHPLLNPPETTSHHKLPLGYSTSTGERESRPFREELWHLHLHYVLRYPCTLHCRHANPRSWSGVFNLLKFDLTPKKKKKKKDMPNM